ncbi:acyl carrier protein [Pseudomonas poae]|uniref:Carrier domain-containing protein n=1 Tax=Pseudomonas poae TaxID=200451 RepID=A0A2S9EF27_9PSED|nr:hypothetical protein CQZ97_18185 [Pseudomonas poae]PRC13655.1 hypothetical protein CQZ99_21100 [Pseudomonas poae]
MYLIKVKEIIANILFLESLDDVESDVPLSDIGFSSIDFIDFCYEIKSQISADIEPHDIWPFARLLVDPIFYCDGRWTESGRSAVSEILGVSSGVEADPKSLDKYWTPEFCARRIESFINV